MKLLYAIMLICHKFAGKICYKHGPRATHGVCHVLYILPDRPISGWDEYQVDICQGGQSFSNLSAGILGFSFGCSKSDSDQAARFSDQLE